MGRLWTDGQLPWELASWCMETRSKRRQQELEAAVIEAPVQTRAQKAARIVGETHPSALTLPTGRKRKQGNPHQADIRSTRRRQEGEGRPDSEAIEEPGQEQHQASNSATLPEEVKADTNLSAEIDHLVHGMDRQRREARRGLEEAAREAEQVGR